MSTKEFSYATEQYKQTNEEILLEVILLTKALYSLARSLFFFINIVKNVTVFGKI